MTRITIHEHWGRGGLNKGLKIKEKSFRE